MRTFLNIYTCEPHVSAKGYTFYYDLTSKQIKNYLLTYHPDFYVCHVYKMSNNNITKYRIYKKSIYKFCKE